MRATYGEKKAGAVVSQKRIRNPFFLVGSPLVKKIDNHLFFYSLLSSSPGKGLMHIVTTSLPPLEIETCCGYESLSNCRIKSSWIFFWLLNSENPLPISLGKLFRDSIFDTSSWGPLQNFVPAIPEAFMIITRNSDTYSSETRCGHPQKAISQTPWNASQGPLNTFEDLLKRAAFLNTLREFPETSYEMPQSDLRKPQKLLQRSKKLTCADFLETEEASTDPLRGLPRLEWSGKSMSLLRRVRD